MQIATVKKYGTQKVLYTMEVKPVRGKELDMFDILKLVNNDMDALKAVGIEKRPSRVQNTGILGISATYQNGCYQGTAPEGPLESCLRLGSEKREPDTIKVMGDGGTAEDTGIRISVSSYLCGLVLATGTTHLGGLLGMGGEEPSYFRKITATKLYYGGKADAYIFESPAKVIRWIEKHACVLEKLSGYHWSVEYATPEAEGYIKGKLGMKPAAAKKWEDDMAQLQKLLDALNDDISNIVDKPVFMTENARIAAENYECGNEDCTDIELDDADYYEEILYRMEQFDMWDVVINSFKEDGTIFMSDGGVVYRLDEGAKKAVEALKEYGVRPYHVIKSRMEFGEMYDVLYVSAIPYEWPQFQRPNPQGIIGSFCVSACTGEFGEFGDIVVKSFGGGLRRVG